jgi:hypothetical protein
MSGPHAHHRSYGSPPCVDRMVLHTLNQKPKLFLVPVETGEDAPLLASQGVNVNLCRFRQRPV